jgi:hypothetical protein
MKLADARGFYDDYSRKASDIARQLGFVGVAIIWLFRNEGTPGRIILPEALLFPAFLIVVSLTLDLFQNVVAAFVWGIYGRWKELSGIGEQDFEAPRQINWPTIFFFVAKFPPLALGYVKIGAFLYSRTFGVQ